MNKTLSDTQYMWASVFLPLFLSFFFILIFLSVIPTKEKHENLFNGWNCLGGQCCLKEEEEKKNTRERELKINQKHTHLSYPILYIHRQKHSLQHKHSISINVSGTGGAWRKCCLFGFLYTNVSLYLIQRFSSSQEQTNGKKRENNKQQSCCLAFDYFHTHKTHNYYFYIYT